jgi:hypothetical protein
MREIMVQVDVAPIFLRSGSRDQERETESHPRDIMRSRLGDEMVTMERE